LGNEREQWAEEGSRPSNTLGIMYYKRVQKCDNETHHFIQLRYANKKEPETDKNVSQTEFS
jgi:hypothetical protein